MNTQQLPAAQCYVPPTSGRKRRRLSPRPTRSPTPLKRTHRSPRHPARVHHHPTHRDATANTERQSQRHPTHWDATANMERQAYHQPPHWEMKANIERQSPPAPILETNNGAGPKGTECPQSRHKKPNYWLSDAAPVAKHQPPQKATPAASPAASPDVSSPARRSSTTSHVPTRIDQCTSNARHLLTQIQFATVSTVKPNRTHVRTAPRNHWSRWNVNC